MPASLSDLPPHLLACEICSYLSATDLLHLGSSNRHLYQVSSSSVLWAPLIKCEFGIDPVHISKRLPPTSLCLMVPQSPTRNCPRLNWKAVYLAAVKDCNVLTCSSLATDMILPECPPPIALSSVERRIRTEMAMMLQLQHCRTNTQDLMNQYASWMLSSLKAE